MNVAWYSLGLLSLTFPLLLVDSAQLLHGSTVRHVVAADSRMTYLDLVTCLDMATVASCRFNVTNMDAFTLPHLALPQISAHT